MQPETLVETADKRVGEIKALMRGGVGDEPRWALVDFGSGDPQWIKLSHLRSLWRPQQRAA